MASVFESMTGPELVSLYNHRAGLQGLPLVKRFSSKAVGIRRLEATFPPEVAVAVEAPELAVTEKNFTDYSDPEMTQIDEFGAFTAELDAFVNLDNEPCYKDDSDLTVAMTGLSPIKSRKLTSYRHLGSLTAILTSIHGAL